MSLSGRPTVSSMRSMLPEGVFGVTRGAATSACPALTAVAPGSTWCYLVDMSAQPESMPPEITQRDLRNRSKEIMDAVAQGHGFTVTRNGHRIGELIPLRHRRRFVPRQEFAAMSRNAPGSDLDAFRADQDATADHEDSDPYER